MLDEMAPSTDSAGLFFCSEIIVVMKLVLILKIAIQSVARSQGSQSSCRPGPGTIEELSA